MAKSLAAIPGVARVAPQRIVPSMIDDHAANLIAFDPASDFSILPWLGEHQPGPLSRDSVITGGRVAARVGEALQICGESLVVHGRLEQTGVGPVDQSYFLSFDALAAINALNHASGAQSGEKAAASANAVNGLAAPHVETDACKADLPLNRVSAYLLQLSPGAKVEESNSLLLSSRGSESSRAMPCSPLPVKRWAHFYSASSCSPCFRWLL